MAPTRTAQLDPQRDFEALRAAARRRFLARARRAGQHAFHDLDEAADDAYQDAWLELVRRPAPAVDDPVGYVAGIMWHRFHRRELRTARAPAAPLDDGLAGDDPSPEEITATREALRAVQEALADLPERERAAVLLRSLGLGLDDVAASLGVTARRARKLSDSGHRRLAAELEAGSAGERCAGFASTLRALSLGWEIGGPRRMRLERHLASCNGCRATVAALRREGRLATMPVVLADGAVEEAPGLFERAAQVATRAWERAPGGSVEASAGAVGGTLATKIVAGCVAAGVAAGCVAIAIPEEPAPSAGAPARPASATGVTPGRPGDAAASQAARAGAERVRRRVRETADAVRDARRKTGRARQRTRQAQRTIRQAQQRTEQAVQKTEQAQQKTGQAVQKTEQAVQKTEQAQREIGDAQAKVEQATGSVERALAEAFSGAP